MRNIYLILCLACGALLSLCGCARTVTSLQLAGNDLVFTVNVSSEIQNGNRYYVIISGSSTDIAVPALGDYFVAPGEGDFDESKLKEFGPDPTTINAYYREYFDTWSDVILFDITDKSSNSGASTYLIKSGLASFPDTVTQNTIYSPTIPNNIEAPYMPGTTQLRCHIPLSQFSVAYAQGARIYFKILTVSDSRILSDLTDGSVYVENTAAADNRGSEAGDAYAGSHGSFDITSWIARVE